MIALFCTIFFAVLLAFVANTFVTAFLTAQIAKIQMRQMPGIFASDEADAVNSAAADMIARTMPETIDKMEEAERLLDARKQAREGTEDWNLRSL